MLKGLKLMEKREVGKQIGVNRLTRCGWIVRMVISLDGMNKYTSLRMSLGEMYGIKVVKLALNVYSRV